LKKKGKYLELIRDVLPFTILSRIEDGTTTRPQDGSTREDALPPGSIPHALFFVSHWTLEQEINNPLLFP